MNDGPIMPKYFYNYGARLDYLRGILLENKIYFKSPFKFNDPFDCRPKVVLGDQRVALRKIEDAIKQAEPEMNRRSRKRAARYVFKSLQKQADLTKDFAQKRADFGVYCLSAINDSLLMWAHYACGHKGYCLEFTNQLGEHSSVYRLAKVQYRDEYPIVKLYAVDQGKEARQAFRTKSSVWCYEKEWRLGRDETGYWNFPPETLTRVILGCEMDPEAKQEIWEMKKNRSAPLELWEAKMDETRYALNFVKLD